jgi:hypothetical protein
MVGTWRPIDDYQEPAWDDAGGGIAPMLVWRQHAGVALGYIRDGELFDTNWVYVSDAANVSHFAVVTAPQA